MLRQIGQYKVAAFYHTDKSFDWMANTYRKTPIRIGEFCWPTTEHYFQAQKFSGNTPAEMAYRDKIINYTGSFKDFPRVAKQMASSTPGLPAFDASAWDGEEGKLNGRSHDAMRTAIRTKINQHSDLAYALDALPEDTIIVEATKNDKKWGDGDDGSGTNHLGILWKELLLERKGCQPQEARKRAYDEYQVFNEVRRGRSLYAYPEFSTADKESLHQDPVNNQSNSIFTSIASVFRAVGSAIASFFRSLFCCGSSSALERQPLVAAASVGPASTAQVFASTQGRVGSVPAAMLDSQQEDSILGAPSHLTTSSAVAAPSFEPNIWFDSTREHWVVERHKNANLQLHFSQDPREDCSQKNVKRVLFRASMGGEWQEGSIQYASAIRLYSDFINYCKSLSVPRVGF